MVDAKNELLKTRSLSWLASRKLMHWRLLMNNLFGVVGVVLLIVVLIIAGPLLILWALNTLFPVLAIPYTVWTWLAALILGSALSPTIRVKK
jgi:hypothetical protein